MSAPEPDLVAPPAAPAPDDDRRELSYGFAAERAALLRELWDKGLPTHLFHLLATVQQPFGVLAIAAILETAGHPLAAPRLRRWVLEPPPGPTP
ncbi:MAG: hypothetical protein ACOCY0_04640 [Roseicyclus sp.]